MVKKAKILAKNLEYWPKIGKILAKNSQFSPIFGKNAKFWPFLAKISKNWVFFEKQNILGKISKFLGIFRRNFEI